MSKYHLIKINPTWFKKGREPYNKGIKGGAPWNKGLTNETSDIIKKCSELKSIKMKGKRPPPKTLEQLKSCSERMKLNNPAKREDVKQKIRESLARTRKEHPEILLNRKPSGINQYSAHFTSIEQLIATELKSRSINYTHNMKIDKFFADFVIYNNIVIECDGEHWHTNKERDARKDQALYNNGYYVFRFAGKRIQQSAKECVNTILSVMTSLGAEDYSMPKNYMLLEA